jgi:hypothetical protein
MLIVTALVVVVCRFAFEKGNDNQVKPIDIGGRLAAHDLSLQDASGALPVPEEYDYPFKERNLMWAPATIEFPWPLRLLQLGKAQVDVSAEQPPLSGAAKR